MNFIKKFITSKFQPKIKVITVEKVRDVHNPNLLYTSEVSTYLLTRIFPDDEFLKGRLAVTINLTEEEHYLLSRTIQRKEGVTRKTINLPLLPLCETLDWLIEKIRFRVNLLGYPDKIEGYIRDYEGDTNYSTGKVNTYSKAISKSLDNIIIMLFSQD